MPAPEIRRALDDLSSRDDHVRSGALRSVLRATVEKVPWANEVWDELVAKLEDPNSYQRSVGLLVLCNLAKSDMFGRLRETLPLLFERTRDERFITSRQCLQNIWKVAAADETLCDGVVEHLEDRFIDCAAEPHANLLRRDIVASLRCLYDAVHDPAVWRRARTLIEQEPSAALRKQYERELGVLAEDQTAARGAPR